MDQPQRPPTVLRFVRAALGPDADGPADADLLARFAREHDEGAFELLVWRHAAMVLGSCRAVLRDHHAAEDACQAAFLALARQAHAVGRRGTVAGWLYRVARRIACRAARRRDAHASASSVGIDRAPAPPADIGPDRDIIRALHEELDRLPEQYRAPVVLCFLDGLSYADAARRLGWPVGTVAGRVARAKDRLRRQLGGRGVAVPIASVGALLSVEAATASVPSSYAAATARAALAFAAGARSVPGVSTNVFQLAREGIRAMTTTKLQWTAVVLAACGALTLGGVWAAGQKPGRVQGDPPAAEGPAEPAGLEAKPAERKATALQRQKSLNNLKQIVIAFHSYHATFGAMPTDIRDRDGKALLSWRVAILPYIEEFELYKQFKLEEPWDGEHNKKLLARMPAMYRLGSEAKGATDSYYQTFAGPGTAFDPGAVERLQNSTGPGLYFRSTVKIPAGFPDGTSNTLIVAEAGPPVPWTKPADIPYDPKKPLPKLAGPFSNVLHAATADGAPHAFRRDIDEQVMRNLIETSDGNVVPDFRTLRARMPATTAEEKAALKERIEQNRKLVGEIGRLMKEQVELISGEVEAAGDQLRAEEHTAKLRQIIDGLREVNRHMRDEKGGKGGADPAPRKK